MRRGKVGVARPHTLQRYHSLSMPSRSMRAHSLWEKLGYPVQRLRYIDLGYAFPMAYTVGGGTDTRYNRNTCCYYSCAPWEHDSIAYLQENVNNNVGGATLNTSWTIGQQYKVNILKLMRLWTWQNCALEPVKIEVWECRAKDKFFSNQYLPVPTEWATNGVDNQASPYFFGPNPVALVSGIACRIQQGRQSVFPLPPNGSLSDVYSPFDSQTWCQYVKMGKKHTFYLSAGEQLKIRQFMPPILNLSEEKMQPLGSFNSADTVLNYLSLNPRLGSFHLLKFSSPGLQTRVQTSTATPPYIPPPVGTTLPVNLATQYQWPLSVANISNQPGVLQGPFCCVCKIDTEVWSQNVPQNQVKTDSLVYDERSVDSSGVTYGQYIPVLPAGIYPPQIFPGV